MRQEEIDESALRLDPVNQPSNRRRLTPLLQQLRQALGRLRGRTTLLGGEPERDRAGQVTEAMIFGDFPTEGLSRHPPIERTDRFAQEIV